MPSETAAPLRMAMQRTSWPALQLPSWAVSWLQVGPLALILLVLFALPTLLFYAAVASLVMPSLLVGFGIGLGFQLLDLPLGLFTSALGAQLTWTFPFGLLAMFAAVARFNRSYEEAATDLGASPWQRLRYVMLPILLPGIVGIGAFTLSYDEYARTTLTVGNQNTLPLEIYALISSDGTPTLFAIGAVTTAVSFLLIGLALLLILRLQRRRSASI